LIKRTQLADERMVDHAVCRTQWRSPGHRIVAVRRCRHASVATCLSRRAHRDFGVPLDPTLIVPGEFTHAYGEAATKRLLAEGVDFTAIFAATDMVAAGVLLTLRQAGV
jgi:DNA-binding LacI/PurR family transcriptional regulator